MRGQPRDASDENHDLLYKEIRYVPKERQTFDRFMHDYLCELTDAIKTDGTLKRLLKEEVGTLPDTGAGLVAALIYPANARLSVGDGMTFKAADPKPKPARYAAQQLAERVHKPTPFETIRYADTVLARRPGCRTGIAAELLGWLAANDAKNAEEREKLFRTAPSQETADLVQAVRQHELFAGLDVHIGEAYLNGEKLRASDFR